MRRILTTLSVWLALAAPAWAACGGASPTWTAASASRDDVAACVTAAVSGDTINVPAGTASWSGLATITITKPLTIIGATSGCPAACDGGTTIQVGTMQPFIMQASNWRISGFTFEGEGNGSGSIYVGYNTSFVTTNWRIDHNHFKDTTGRGITVSAGASAAGYNHDLPGLIDHNRFSAPTLFKALEVNGGSLTAHGLWDTPLDLGGSSWVFFEDNAIVHTNAAPSGLTTINGSYNAKFVVRFNSFQNGAITAHGQELGHPGDGEAYKMWYSVFGWEVYGNTFHYSPASLNYLFWMRGGTGVLWGNTWTGTQGWATPASYSYQRGDQASLCADQVLACQGANPYDGNTTGLRGYPCYQQPGMTGSNGITPMPVYQFGNTYFGSTNESLNTWILSDPTNCGPAHVLAGRDVIGLATSDSGPVANRPTEPCTNDAGYWATDEGGNWNKTNATANDGHLYKCVSGAWEDYYTPYEYPHPLQGGTATTPNAPTNVRIR